VECDVVGLPLERRLAGVHGRRDLVVNRAAVVALHLQTVRVEHLEFVIAGQVDSAVAPGLDIGVRHVRDIELDVELEVSEGLIGHDVAVADRENAVGERPLRRSLAIRLNPALEAFPAQQDAGTGGRTGSQGGVAWLRWRLGRA